jgi:hypothetical protein
LTTDQLEDTAKAVAEGGVIEDPVIQRLQRNIVTIGMQVSGSFSQKLKRRSEIKGLIVRDGMPAFWMAINPSDLRHPLVLLLAGAEYSGDAFPTANAAIRQATATSNPVAVAQFFHHTCKGVFDGILDSNSGRIGILGPVASHFGVVETNGRGMLHLHALVWLSGNLGFTTLRDRVLQNKPFASRMIRYSESIIVHSIDLDLENGSGEPAYIPPPSKRAESDDAKLSIDSSAIACKKQVHSSNHNATCFKYGQKGQGSKACRFKMPRELRPTSEVDEFGVIHLARNNGWFNPWNPAIASCIRSNQDISWIPTVVKALCLIYYITNYATKDDVSPYQMLVKAALLKQSIENAKATLTPGANDLRIRKKDMDQFALRCFNTLSHDREISGVQIASSLLQLPTYYTNNYNFVQVNLWWLRKYVYAAINLAASQGDGTTDLMDEEQCAYRPGETVPVSRFDNYKWRGPYLAHLPFFEYCMLVQTKNVREAIAADLEFDLQHPKHGIQVQRLAHKKSQVVTVTFSGRLSQFQAEEEGIPGGHPVTTAMENDLAEVLLGLFVPWNQLPALFQQCSAEYGRARDACAKVWKIVEPTLSPHNRNFASNLELLRKSQEDSRIDAALRRAMNGSQNSFDRDLDGEVPDDLELDDEDSLNTLQEDFSTETLIAACHSVAMSWCNESLLARQRILALLSGATKTRVLQLKNLLPLDIFRLGSYPTSGL